MRARSHATPLLVGYFLLTLMTVGFPRGLDAAPVGFAPGGIYPIANATGPTQAVAGNGVSTLGIGTAPFNPTIIDNYMGAGTCPWLAPALAAEGYSAANGWTINYVTLPVAAISLTTYAAWVNTKPAATGGDITLAAAANNAQLGNGGAAIGLSYNPSPAAITAGDPNPAGASYLNWIQVLATTNPYGFGTTYGVNVGGGFTAEIDNDYLKAGALPNNPFYGGLNGGDGYAGDMYSNGSGPFAADKTGLVDRPSQPLPTSINSPYTFEAQTFLATWSPKVAPGASNSTNSAAVIAGGGTITVYDGVWWGFQLTVPEPSTYALMVSAGLCGLIVRVYRTLRERQKSGIRGSSCAA